ncbi:hypothetical protein [Prochlorococcus sp. MIT 1223]|uniref:hypothetical protein n=1 Tax=Prochlorococcus sp. MIT 1223 TaxID=3096217 RepID=UPI002A761460|nr:hypothetical protein [Prochlorococcus sp. MIT 1223]
MPRDQYSDKAQKITRVNGQDIGFPVRKPITDNSHRRGHYQGVRDEAQEARLFNDAVFEYENRTGHVFYKKEPTIKRLKQLVRAKRLRSSRINAN